MTILSGKGVYCPVLILPTDMNSNRRVKGIIDRFIPSGQDSGVCKKVTYSKAHPGFLLGRARTLNQLPLGNFGSMLPLEYFTFQSLYEANSRIMQTVQSKDLAKSVFDKGGLGACSPRKFCSLDVLKHHFQQSQTIFSVKNA